MRVVADSHSLLYYRALTPGAFDLLSSTVLDTSDTGFDVVPVDVATMLELTSFPLEPLRDPWDRMIVSTAKSSTAYPSYLPTGPSQPSEQSTSSGNPGMTESEICSTPANLELNDRLIVSMVA